MPGHFRPSLTLRDSVFPTTPLPGAVGTLLPIPTDLFFHLTYSFSRCMLVSWTSSGDVARRSFMGERKFWHAVEILGWFLIIVFILNLPLSGRAYGREST